MYSGAPKILKMIAIMIIILAKKYKIKRHDDRDGRQRSL